MCRLAVAKLFNGGLVGRTVQAQKYCGIANIHIEGEILNLMAGVCGRGDGRDVDVAVFFESAGRNKICHALKIGRADHNVRLASQIFDCYVKNDALVECLYDTAGGFHEMR